MQAPADHHVERTRIRQQLRQNRRAFVADESARDAAETAITHQLHHLTLHWPETAIIACTLPHGNECSLSRWMQWALAQGRSIALPCVEERDAPLTFRQWDGDMANLMPDALSLLAPLSQPIAQPDVVLVPLLGFDADGQRMGQGGGYYDRTLAALAASGHHPLRLGVAFACQQVETVRPEPWDEPLHAVLTEKGLMTFGTNHAMLPGYTLQGTCNHTEQTQS